MASVWRKDFEMKEHKQNSYSIVADRDGEHCKGCGVSASERKLLVDGYSNSQANEDPTTMMLLCLSCILLKHPTKLSELCVSEREKVKESENGSYETELHKAKVTEPRFRLLVYQMLQEAKNLMWEQGDLCNSCAEELDFSPIVAKRYLDKLCSSRGVLTRVRKDKSVYITFKLEGFLQ